jgi:hypothetical protein
MKVLFAWTVGIAFAVWICRWLWKARRDAQIRKMMAAGMAGEIACESVGLGIADETSEWSTGDGGDGGDGGD